ncbi:MAG TPA: alpha/beta fold hydrolase [Pyrinomonadaceae bacterium]|nr:alpha/beta fold hydrolase [Pyrinomonadaceae bacterium]
MRRFVRPALYAILLLALGARAAVAQEQRFAGLGNFRLESGEVLRDCRIGYRTFGTPNKDRSNVVLVTTWASGTTEQWVGNLGPGRLIDSTKYFVVAVDALANGVSSSPSNSRRQPRMRFPKVTIRDMVNTQHRLLTTVLGVSHVKAVAGLSMGGMQTFQWLVSYPDFMDKAVSIIGSPRLAPYDLLHWQTQLDAIFRDPDWRRGNYVRNPARVAEAEFGALLLTTPEEYNKRMTREKVFEELEKAKSATGGYDANNKIRQVQAMMALDVTEGFGGSLERAAAAVRAEVFVIVASKDHVVTPGPAVEFARHLRRSKLLVLDNDCGHNAPWCEQQRVGKAVAEFLD